MNVGKTTREIVLGSLIAVLSLLFFSTLGIAADVSWAKIIDYGDPGYSETGNAWRTYAAFGHNGTYRYLSHYDSGRTRVGTATWSTAVPYSGTYRVSVSYRMTDNRSPDADYFVTNNDGGSDHFVINQSGPAQLYKWKTLGDYHYKKGQIVKVFLDGTDDTYSDCADAASWELVELDPPPVVSSAVTLLLR